MLLDARKLPEGVLGGSSAARWIERAWRGSGRMVQLMHGDSLRLQVALASLVLLSFLTSLGAGATTLIPMTVGEIVDEAELIFIGTAQSLEVTQEPYQAFEESPVEEWPFRYVTFAVTEVLKGGVEEQALTLAFPGRRRQGLELRKNDRGLAGLRNGQELPALRQRQRISLGATRRLDPGAG